MRRLASTAWSGAITMLLAAGCGGEEPRPIEQAQDAREQVQQNLSAAEESLEEVDESLENIQEQLIEKQQQNAKLKEQLAEERRAREAAEAELARARGRPATVAIESAFCANSCDHQQRVRRQSESADGSRTIRTPWIVPS